MVNAKSAHPLRRQPVEKLREGTFYAVSTANKSFNSIQESREELYLPFQSHKSTICDQHKPPVPQWGDTRSLSPDSSGTDVHLSAQTNPFFGQNNHHNVQLSESSSQWDGYSVQSGDSRQQRNAKAQNIWSSQSQSFRQASDSSVYSASTNPSISSYSLSALNASTQRNHVQVQHSYNYNIRDITASMNRSHLKDMKDDNKTVGASISSATSYSSNTVPGVVGASSGSTGGTGGSSFTGQQFRSNYSSFYPHAQSMMNSSAQAFYPNQHPIQQERAPPGFQPYEQHGPSSSEILEERNFIRPKYGNSEYDNVGFSKGRYQKNVHRETTKRKSGKYEGLRSKDRKSIHDGGVSNRERGNNYRKNRSKQLYRKSETECEGARAEAGDIISNANSDAIRMIMNPQGEDLQTTGVSSSSSDTSALTPSRLPLEHFAVDNSQATVGAGSTSSKVSGRAILPSINDIEVESHHDKDGDNYISDDDDEEGTHFWGAETSTDNTSTNSKKKDWLLRMNRRLIEIPVGDLDPSTTPISAIMNGWAKTKSSHGASMVEKWLDRAQGEFEAGNTKVVPTNKMFTMAVDAWAKSGEGVSAAQRAETILQHMNEKYQTTGLENLRPTTGIFNAVINAWARSKEKIAPSRAEQILKWMDNLHKTNPSIKPDKYTFNTGEYNVEVFRCDFRHWHYL